jgi:CheY-like chemotaxis protein
MMRGPPGTWVGATRGPARGTGASGSGWVGMEPSDPSARAPEGLDGRRILIVEDEVLIAEDLAHYFVQLGCEVLGPAGTLAEGFGLIDRAELAVLDIALGNEMVFPLAEVLLARGVPFVFFTARASLGVPAHLAGVGRVAKPASYARVGRALADRLEPEPPDDHDDIVRLLPKLRIAAQLVVRDPAAADRLVERALERAIAELALRDPAMSLDDWIVTIMTRVAREDRRRSMI